MYLYDHVHVSKFEWCKIFVKEGIFIHVTLSISIMEKKCLLWTLLRFNKCVWENLSNRKHMSHKRNGNIFSISHLFLNLWLKSLLDAASAISLSYKQNFILYWSYGFFNICFIFKSNFISNRLFFNFVYNISCRILKLFVETNWLSIF